MSSDSTKLNRKAQRLWLDYRIGTGTPPSFESQWSPAYAVGIDSIQINSGPRSSLATITFPSLRWDEKYASSLSFGDRVRIYKPASGSYPDVTIFSGFVTREISEFSGGSGKTSGYERCSLGLADHRWLLSVGTAIFGQTVRGFDDYNNFGTTSQTPYAQSSTFLSGRRCIFNESGKPNADPVIFTIGTSDITDPPGRKLPDDGITHSFTLFEDSDRGIYWTARDMIGYVTSIYKNSQYAYAPINSSNTLGLSDPIFDTVLNDISVEGLSIIEALTIICDPLGVSFREEYTANGDFWLVFYKLGSAKGSVRTYTDLNINHELYAPAVGEDISDAVSRGEKMVRAANLDRDISSAVTTPIGLGAKMQFEFTAELVPAFLDADVVIDDNSDYVNVFMTDATLKTTANPNSYDYYKYHHSSGSYFRPNAARRWSLNESGRYSVSPAWQSGRNYPSGFIVNKGGSFYRAKKSILSSTSNQPPSANWESITDDYDRGKPFDFSTVIDRQYVTDSKGKRILAAMKKQLLNSLTVIDGGNTSAGVSVEFSFDGGSSWQPIACSITALSDEFGINIAEPNLANIHPDKQTQFSSGDLAGLDINLFSSIADDIISGRSFKAGDWNSRVRITASVAIDSRIFYKTIPTSLPATAARLTSTAFMIFLHLTASPSEAHRASSSPRTAAHPNTTRPPAFAAI